MTTEELAFYAAIWAEPIDDAPRLVFCDWLDEQETKKHTELAELIRLDIRMRRSKGKARGLIGMEVIRRRIRTGHTPELPMIPLGTAVEQFLPWRNNEAYCREFRQWRINQQKLHPNYTVKTLPTSDPLSPLPDTEPGPESPAQPHT